MSEAFSPLRNDPYSIAWCTYWCERLFNTWAHIDPMAHDYYGRACDCGYCLDRIEP